MEQLAHVDLDKELFEIVDEAARKNIAALQEEQEELKELCDPDVILSNAITETSSPTMPNSYSGRLLVEEIGGESQQFTTTGKNLIDFTKGRTTTGGGVTYTVQSDGSYKRTGTATDAVGNVWLLGYYGITPSEDTRLVHLEAGKNYYVKDCILFFGTSGFFGGIVDATKYPNGIDITAVRNIEFEVGKTYDDVVYPMVCEAEYGVDWEPYTGGIPSPNPSYPQEIKKTVVSEIRTHGKNLLSYDNNYKYTNGGITVEAVGDGYSYKVYGTATKNIAVQIPMSIASEKVCIFSSSYANNNNSNITLYYTENGSSTIKALFPSRTIDLNNNNIHYLAFYVLSGATVNYVAKVQLEEGTVATEYEPYTESVITLSQPIDLYGIGGVQDVITPKKIERKFGVKVFDGTEDIIIMQAGNNDTTYFCCTNTSLKLNTGNYLTGNLCTRLIEQKPSDLWDRSNIGFAINTTNHYPVRFRFGADINTVELAKAKLKEWYNAGNPMIIVYELATETTEALPIADQIALNSLATYDGITYLEFDSEIEPTFKGRYGASEVGGVASEAYCDGLINGITAQEHSDNKDNPHGVTKAQVGLGKVENKSVEEILASLTKEDIDALKIVAAAVSSYGDKYRSILSSGILWFGLEESEEWIGNVHATYVKKDGVNTHPACEVATQSGIITCFTSNGTMFYAINPGKIPLTDDNYTEDHLFRGDARVIGNLKVNGGVWNDEINFNKVGLQGGAAQPVEWVWDGSLQRWVLCTITEQQE